MMTECPVCGARSSSPLWSNFGAKSCFQCRTFFRKWVIGGSKAQICECRKGELCSKCRGEKCLEIGMKADLAKAENFKPKGRRSGKAPLVKVVSVEKEKEPPPNEADDSNAVERVAVEIELGSDSEGESEQSRNSLEKRDLDSLIRRSLEKGEQEEETAVSKTTLSQITLKSLIKSAIDDAQQISRGKSTYVRKAGKKSFYSQIFRNSLSGILKKKKTAVSPVALSSTSASLPGSSSSSSSSFHSNVTQSRLDGIPRAYVKPQPQQKTLDLLGLLTQKQLLRKDQSPSPKQQESSKETEKRSPEVLISDWKQKQFIQLQTIYSDPQFVQTLRSLYNGSKSNASRAERISGSFRQAMFSTSLYSFIVKSIVQTKPGVYHLGGLNRRNSVTIFRRLQSHFYAFAFSQEIFRGIVDLGNKMTLLDRNGDLFVQLLLLLAFRGGIAGFEQLCSFVGTHVPAEEPNALHSGIEAITLRQYFSNADFFKGRPDKELSYVTVMSRLINSNFVRAAFKNDAAQDHNISVALVAYILLFNFNDNNVNLGRSATKVRHFFTDAIELFRFSHNEITFDDIATFLQDLHKLTAEFPAF